MNAAEAIADALCTMNLAAPVRFVDIRQRPHVFEITISSRGGWINVEIMPTNAGRSGRARYGARYGYSLTEQRWSYGQAPSGDHKAALETALGREF